MGAEETFGSLPHITKGEKQMAQNLELIKALFFSGEGIKPKRSNMHLLMPTVVIAILVILAVIILIQRAMRCKKEGKPFISFKGYRFFIKDFSPVIFFSSIVLMIVYFYLLPIIHFLPASIIFLMIFNVLYNKPVVDGKLDKKSLLVSAIISVVGPLLIYVLFAVAFGLTLP